VIELAEHGTPLSSQRHLTKTLRVTRKRGLSYTLQDKELHVVGRGSDNLLRPLAPHAAQAGAVYSSITRMLLAGLRLIGLSLFYFEDPQFVTPGRDILAC
jgi:hypothetical protein